MPAQVRLVVTVEPLMVGQLVTVAVTTHVVPISTLPPTGQLVLVVSGLGRRSLTAQPRPSSWTSATCMLFAMAALRTVGKRRR
jgi:hypothetical protein